MQSVKFTQVCIDICISLTDLPWYKEYILHHKVKYCVCKIPKTVEFGSTAFMVWVSDWRDVFFDFREEKEKFILLSQKSRVEIRNYIFS